MKQVNNEGFLVQRIIIVFQLNIVTCDCEKKKQSHFV